MGKIQILDEHIANQIAAGEVVERPASIVKELIENSIDAGSTKIEVYIKEGGLTSIQIKDNGDGIDGEDVEKAFFRHATSKIKGGRDLFRIKTLGFRGEALPSIAAVSRLSLKTSTNTSGRGIELQLEAGKIVHKKEIAYVKGTEIIVQDIFFNTPARLKYMKSLQTELGHITDYVNRLSLDYPNIAFTLVHNERLILRTNGDGNLLHVIAAIYGTSAAKSMIEVNDEHLDFGLKGYIAKPEITRSNKNHMSIFVNGRYIKNYMISQAVIRGFKTLLMVNRFPIAVLHIEMDPSLVDVNVHPSKLQARFSKEQELIRFIEAAIQKSLNQHSFIREPIQAKNPQIKYQQPVQSSFDLTLRSKENQQTRGIDSFETMNSDDFIAKESSRGRESIENHEKVETHQEEAGGEKLPLLDPIAQFQGTYIIAQSEKGLYLIDQHAAHERIYYEKNIALMNEEGRDSQELLVPLTLDFPKSEIEQIVNKLERISTYGINIELFGQQTFIIRSIPSWIPQGKEQEYMEKMIQMVLSRDEVNLEELRQDMIASSSCKSAIKANHYLTKQEMETLLEQLRQTNNPFSCPHGRPIIIHFSIYEIEKMFKRVV